MTTELLKSTEKSVLSSILFDEDVVFKVAEVLQPEDFYTGSHRIIYSAILSLFSERSPITLTSIATQIQKEYPRQSNVHIEALGSLFKDGNTSQKELDYNIRVVKEHAVARAVVSHCEKTKQKMLTMSEDVFEVVGELNSSLLEISNVLSNKTVVTLGESVVRTMAKVEKIRSGEIKAFGIPTGIRDLDNMVGGLEAGQLVIIAGRPSMGKTSAALSIARYISNHNITSFYSLEMPESELGLRLFAAESGVSYYTIRTGRWTNEQGYKLLRASEVLPKAKFYIWDKSAMSLLDLQVNIRRDIIERKVKVVFVDYLQLMSVPNRAERNQEIGDITRGLKVLAKDFNVPIVVLSQLNRLVEYRGEKRPMLADLRDSGNIEQDADVVIFVYRPEVYGIDKTEDGFPTDGYAELVVAKNRNGATGIVPVAFLKETMKFENLAKIEVAVV